MGVGARTVNGTRAAVRTVIRYRHGVLSGRGASLLDGYMEDLATDRIYRLMIAQRVLHRDLVPVQDEQGQPVKHTPEFITQLFDEELERLLLSLPANTDPEEAERFRGAREISEAMIVNGEFNPA
jgi:malate synthase